MRSAAAFQLVIWPSSVLLMIASNEESTIAASHAICSFESGTAAPVREEASLMICCCRNTGDGKTNRRPRGAFAVLRILISTEAGGLLVPPHVGPLWRYAILESRFG